MNENTRKYPHHWIYIFNYGNKLQRLSSKMYEGNVCEHKTPIKVTGSSLKDAQLAFDCK